MKVFPLIFEPILKPRIWGGRRLGTLLGKRLPDDGPIGESWELADLPGGQSRVAGGPAQGKTLAELVHEWGEALTGRAPLSDDRFPLLLKFLDARETLSVQVHPTETTVRQRGPNARVKNEAWYVIDAEPDSIIYRGLLDGVTPNDLREALTHRAVERILRKLPARKGHAYYLPSGTVHALGGGILVAEVQTPSDTTYRLYDWDRVDPATGRPRDLQIDDGLASAAFAPVPPESERVEHVASVWTSVTGLIRCPSFVIERVRMVEGVEQAIAYAEMVVWMVLEGRGRIVCDGLDQSFLFGAGDTVLIPAGLTGGRVITEVSSMWLEVSIPIESSLSGFARPARSELENAAEPKLVSLNVPPGRPRGP